MRSERRDGFNSIEASPSSLLRSTAAAPGDGSTTAAPGLVSSTRSLATDAATATGRTTRVRAVERGAETALLDLDFDSTNRVRVAVDCVLESSGRLEVNKGTVLRHRLANSKSVKFASLPSGG